MQSSWIIVCRARPAREPASGLCGTTLTRNVTSFQTSSSSSTRSLPALSIHDSRSATRDKSLPVAAALLHLPRTNIVAFFWMLRLPFSLSFSIAYGRMERRRRRIQDGRIRSCFENDQIFKVATDKAVDEERVIAAYAWREEAERGKEKRPEALVFPSCVTVPPSFQQRATVTRNPEGMDVSYPPIFPLNPLSSDPPFEQTSENRAL